MDALKARIKKKSKTSINMTLAEQQELKRQERYFARLFKEKMYKRTMGDEFANKLLNGYY